ncbi:hypothetical protein Moror_3291 [Moniliophthora roreri MCA 2997]|uniref:Uncharacterized protein n=1 Tax=Moniliophthora roreri (strain MCA 2997) TaxID=1381753 RepID=V2W8S3_MONRO|nr:hypothetical protein Moror_3291 [Moniliophthora roreri MCA 2997]
MIVFRGSLLDVALKQITAAVQFLFYGAYIVSFGICTHILLRKKKRCHHYHILANVILFLLVTANVILYTLGDITDWCHYDSVNPDAGDDRCWTPRIRFEDTEIETTFASSAVADAILLWRCYKVWGKQRKVIILPTILYLVGHVAELALSSSGVFGYALPRIAIAAGIIALNNLILTTLISFRIFRMSREVVAYVSPKANNKYGTIIAATLESGLLYSTFLVVFLFLWLVLELGGSDYSEKVIEEACLRIWAPIAASAFCTTRLFSVLTQAEGHYIDSYFRPRHYQ